MHVREIHFLGEVLPQESVGILKWSTKTGHRVKAVNCHGEVNDDNKETTDLYGRV